MHKIIEKTVSTSRYFILSGVCLLVTALSPNTPAQAQTLYIQPTSEIAMRRGQGTDYKIIAMVKDGMAVELLEANDKYTRVRLPNDKEGWVLTRFLSIDPPLREVVATLRMENEEMQQELLKTSQELESVSSTMSTVEKELHTTINERDTIKNAYKILQKNTADTVQIKNDQLETAQENEQLHQAILSVRQENESLQNASSVKWFLSGGGVLLLGMLIGKVSGHSQKKKSSLY